MQTRVVDLIDRITDDELTAELLRINDEMNNLFLRHQRYEKNRNSKTKINSPSEVLGAALGIKSANLDVNNSSGVNRMDKMKQSKQMDVIEQFDYNTVKKDLNKLVLNNDSPSRSQNRNADEFDILAKSRTNNGGGGGSSQT